LAFHLIADNYATHKHSQVKDWLARHPRFYLHFTPTYSTWLNQIERWFALITQQAIRGGSFRHVRELADRIEEYLAHYTMNTNAPSSGMGQTSLAKLEGLAPTK
jgi:putative transposase